MRKLQQVLACPGRGSDNVLTELEVPRSALFRPCIGRSDVSKSTCEFELPDPPAEGADAATVRKAYDRLRFGTKQMWDTYRTGFRREASSPSDYPYTGYPFTGMGWTYDWGTAAQGHFGVTEFVVRRDAVIKIVGENSPAVFCARPARKPTDCAPSPCRPLHDRKEKPRPVRRGLRNDPKSWGGRHKRHALFTPPHVIRS